MIDVDAEGLCVRGEAERCQEGKVSGREHGMPEVTVDVDVADVAGSGTIDEPGGQDGFLAGIGLGGGIRGGFFGE